MVFTKHIEVGKISCLQCHVSSFELNMQLRDILHHFKPTAEAAASTSVFVHLILGQNTYKCFTTLGALPKHFFGFDVLSRSGQPQLSNLTNTTTWNESLTNEAFITIHAVIIVKQGVEPETQKREPNSPNPAQNIQQQTPF